MSFDPIQRPDDSVYINDRLVPGIVVISGLKAERDWEERRSFGMIGARRRYKGQKLSHFALVVSLYTQEHWEDWLEFGPLVRRPPPPDRSQLTAITSIPSFHRLMRTQAPPLAIRHPLLEEYRIRRVVVEDVTAPVEDDKGVWGLEIKLIQYQRPQRALSSSGGSSDEPAGNARIAELRATLADRRETLDQLATQGNR